MRRLRRTQPAAYLKVVALLIPREHKVEHSNPLKDLTDDQLEAMIEYIETSLEAQAGGPVKMIEGTTEPTAVEVTVPTALEPPKPKNRLMLEVDTAVGPQERKPRKRVPSRHPSILSGGMRFALYASFAVKARPRLTSSSRSAADP